MKILNKNKIIVSALALCIGASLAGSVSGTIAWYQYSTRANVAFIGESGGFSGNLQMRFLSEADDDSAWRTRISWQEMNANLTTNGYAEKIVPMTFGAMDKDDARPADGYLQPLPGVGDMTKWAKADKKNYAQFQLQLRYNERDGAEEGEPAVDDKNVAKDVYLSKVLIQQDANNGEKGDLSDAIRVHISSSDTTQIKNKLISNQGKEIATKGALDIDGAPGVDQVYPDGDEFGFAHDENDLIDVIYGDDGNDSTKEIQSSYKANATDYVAGAHYTQQEIDDVQSGDPAEGKTTDDWKVEPVYPAIVYSKDNVLYNNSEANSSPESGKSLGKTVAGDAAYLTVTVTIWVEGWQPLDDNAIWDAKYIKSKFNVGIQFAVQDAFGQNYL